MQRYYINTRAQSTGEHEIHKESCRWLPSENDRFYLGCFASDAEALKAARRYYYNVDGCMFCCASIHHR